MKVFLCKLKEVFQGIAIGIANVIPGFSGGTMAVIFQVYERIIRGLSDFFQHPIRVIKDVWAIFIGLVIGILIAIVGIVKLLELAPIPTIMFFVGLMIGTIPFIFKTTKEYGKVKLVDIICFIIAIIIIVLLPLLNGKQIEHVEISFGLVLIMFLLGLVAAATMIIPGVSGSLVLLVLGYYFVITSSISNLLDGLIGFDFSNITTDFIILLSFGVGAVVGLVLVSKLIKLLLNKNPKVVYWTILGLLLASPYSIIVAVTKEYPDSFSKTDVLGYIIAFVMLVIGALVSGYFSFYENKNTLKEENKE